MLAMCRELGFDVKRDPNDAATDLVSLDLTTRSFGANDNAALVRNAVH